MTTIHHILNSGIQIKVDDSVEGIRWGVKIDGSDLPDEVRVSREIYDRINNIRASINNAD